MYGISLDVLSFFPPPFSPSLPSPDSEELLSTVLFSQFSSLSVSEDLSHFAAVNQEGHLLLINLPDYFQVGNNIYVRVAVWMPKFKSFVIKLCVLRSYVCRSGNTDDTSWHMFLTPIVYEHVHVGMAAWLLRTCIWYTSIIIHMYKYRTASLLRPCLLLCPPPPYFRADRVILPPLHAPSLLRAARVGLRYCSSSTVRVFQVLKRVSSV